MKTSKTDIYRRLTPEERMALAVSTGQTTSRGLTRKDSVLARIMRWKKEMGAFLLQQRNFGRRAHYAGFSTEKLVSHAVNVLRSNSFEYFRQLQNIDTPLYDSLRERQVTALVADEAGLKGARRRTSGKSQERRVRRQSRQSECAGMSDDELFKAVMKTKTVGSKSLMRHDCVLYEEVRARPAVRDRLVAIGWRRSARSWDGMKLNDWLELCGQFDTADNFRRGYQAAYTHARKSGYWPEILATLKQCGKWQGICGLDGRAYQSRAECIVANWLFLSKICYESHPLLPWKDSRRRYQADFRLSDHLIWVEVFLCSSDRPRKDTDPLSWAPSYLRKRRRKVTLYSRKARMKLLVIEADVYRYEGLKAYLTHVQQRFAEFGIQLVDPGSVALELGSDQRGMKWTVTDFVDYAGANNIVRFSGFQAEGHRDLYTVLRSRELRDEVRRALDAAHGRTVRARKESLPPLGELRDVCRALGIQTRAEYEEAYRTHKLSTGAPISIRQSYGVQWGEFINGKGRREFWSWQRARDYVRSRGFRNREEFVTAVQNDPAMSFIRRNPGNQTAGGYAEWTDWYDFLGKARYVRVNEGSARTAVPAEPQTRLVARAPDKAQGCRGTVGPAMS